MSYDFRLEFSGLCAFVPDKDVEEGAEVITAILVSTMTRIEDTDGGEVAGSESHQPLLVFDLNSIGAESGGDGKNCGVWFLDGEDVTLHFKRGGAEYPVGPLRVRLDNTERSFSLVPLMERALPGAGQVDPDCLEGVPSDTAGKLVRARIYLDKGTLFASELAKYRGQRVTAQFVPPPDEEIPVYKQYMPRRVTLEVSSVPDDVLTVIRARKIRIPDSYRELVLSPIEGQDGARSVVAEVRNLCCESVLADKDKESFPEADLDFLYYYQIAARYKELSAFFVEFPIPVPVEFINRITLGQGGGDTIKCSSARFNAPIDEEEEQATDAKEEV
jgi:hypothetical protein